MFFDWTEKADGEDVIFAKDVNDLAHAIKATLSVINQLEETMKDSVHNLLHGIEKYVNDDNTLVIDDNGTQYLLYSGIFENGTYLYHNFVCDNFRRKPKTENTLELIFNVASRHIAGTDCDSGGLNLGETDVLVTYADKTTAIFGQSYYTTTNTGDKTITINGTAETYKTTEFNFQFPISKEIESIAFRMVSDNYYTEGDSTDNLCRQEILIKSAICYDDESTVTYSELSDTIRELKTVLDGKLDKTFDSNGYTSIDEVTEHLNNIKGISEASKVTSVQGRTGDVILTKADVELDKVPNVSTNEQMPTFTEASTRTNVVSGDTLQTIMGKIKKWFADLKSVAFTGSYTDLSDKPTTATTSANGLMSASDKTKLNGIATNANNYTHPSTHGASMITQDSTHRFVTDAEKTIWNDKIGASDYAYGSSSADGWYWNEIAETFVDNFVVPVGTNGFAGMSEVVERAADDVRSTTIVIGASDSKYRTEHVSAVDYICGGTNDQTYIQAAISALPSTGGKIVLLDGTYNIGGTITINKSNVTIQGLGRNVILKAATSTATLEMFSVSNATGLIISDIVIDYANNTSGSSTAIKLYSSNHVVIDHVNILNHKGNGIEWFSCNYTRFSDVSFINVRQCIWDRGRNHSSIFDKWIVDTVTNGITLDLSSTLNKIADCIVRSATENGIKSDAAYTMINDNIVYGCSNGITVNGNCSTVADNNVRDSDIGISVNGKYVNVSGNTAIRADGSGNISSYSSSQYTILMGSSSANCLVISNIIGGKNYTNNGATTNTFANNKY